MNMKKLAKVAAITAGAAGLAFVALTAVAIKKKPESVYADEPEQKNPMQGRQVQFVPDENDKENADGAKGHLVPTGTTQYKPTFYAKYGKRAMDVVLSFGGLVATAI